VEGFRGTQGPILSVAANVKSPFLLLFGLVPLLASADQVDQVVAKDMKRFGYPGLCVGVVKNGKLVKKKAYGSADVELGAPMKDDDIFEIGSMTKQFTAMLTLMLVDEGKIGLDDPVSKYIPESPEAWKSVTIRHMLNQNSGLPEYALIPTVGLMDDYDREKWMKVITPLPLDFPTGSAWAYSNTNFALLGWVIEKITGKPYGEVLTARVLKPLGMDHTRIENVQDVIPRRAHGYLPGSTPGALVRVEGSKAAIQADGALLSNIDDLVKWDAALEARKLLSPAGYNLLWSAGRLESGRTYPYGMGWFLGAPGGAPVVYHPGADVGFASCITRYTSAHVTVIVLSNLYGSAPQATATHIAEVVDAAVKPAIPIAKADPDPTRSAAARAALEALASHKLDPTQLTPDLTGPLNASRAKAFPQYGDFTKMSSFLYAGETPQGDDRMIAFRLKNERRSGTVYVLWTPDRKIAEVFMRPDPVS